MSLEKHSLLKEFPEHHHTIRHLKMNDAHFARQFDNYHELDHEIFHIESNGVDTSDIYLEQQKRLRLQLKDSLWQQIQKETAAQ